MADIEILTPKQLMDLLKSGEGVHLIDVRTPLEFQEVHVREAQNVPLDTLVAERLPQDEKPIAFICKSGTRGRMACEKIQKVRGTVYNVEGGTQACVDAGLSVVRGKKAMSLERQVRIAAGSLVLLGFGLSFLHPWFIGISAFVGAGLVFAGVTDTCAMGMMISKMPWNRA